MIIFRSSLANYFCNWQVDLKATGGTKKLLNIYAPAEGDKLNNPFFMSISKKIKKFIDKDESHSFILGGDMNAKLDPILDRKIQKISTNKYAEYTRLYQDLNAIDAWRATHGSEKQFTYQKKMINSDTTQQTRIDTFIVPESTQNFEIHICPYD